MSPGGRREHHRDAKPARGRSAKVGPAPTGRASSPRRTAVDAGEVVEGRQAVRELLAARRRGVRSVSVSETAEVVGVLAEIVELAGAAGVPLRRVARSQLAAMAGTDAPQGVVALADPLAEVDLAQLLERPGDAPPPLLVVLDGVSDPHNLGAVMRSALCAGASGVVVARHRSAKLGPAALKAAAGAAEWLPVCLVAGVPAALSELAAAGVWTVGLDAGAGSALWGLPVATQPVALVLGAEGGGMSRLARQRCDTTVSIPLEGPLASLNVAAAATLACFEVSRLRAAAADRPGR